VAHFCLFDFLWVYVDEIMLCHTAKPKLQALKSILCTQYFFSDLIIRGLLTLKHRLLFSFHVTVHRKKVIFNKTNKSTNFPNLFCQDTLHVSGSSSAHHQEFSNVHSAVVYVMHV
jgi:hypothetical protein